MSGDREMMTKSHGGKGKSTGEGGKDGAHCTTRHMAVEALRHQRGGMRLINNKHVK